MSVRRPFSPSIHKADLPSPLGFPSPQMGQGKRIPTPLLLLWEKGLGEGFAPLREEGNSEQGLTLIECLVAIIIITLTVVAITPPIFLATASRVQARRAEQANQIAQAEVDRIRAIVERGVYEINQLPDSNGVTSVQAFAAPVGADGVLVSTSSTCATTKYPKTDLTQAPVAADKVIPVDIDGDCKPEFAMQVFRTGGCVPSSVTVGSPPYSFYLGVRVYSYDPLHPPTGFASDRAILGMTAGRNDQGGGVSKPFQVLYSKVARSNNDKAYECVAK